MRSRPTLHIAVGSSDEERARLRSVLDDFERRYGVPSHKLASAFTDSEGRLDETDDFHAWDNAWTAYQILNSR